MDRNFVLDNYQPSPYTVANVNQERAKKYLNQYDYGFETALEFHNTVPQDKEARLDYATEILGAPGMHPVWELGWAVGILHQCYRNVAAERAA